jgi:hypothetical protein
MTSRAIGRPRRVTRNKRPLANVVTWERRPYAGFALVLSAGPHGWQRTYGYFNDQSCNPKAGRQ